MIYRFLIDPLLFSSHNCVASQIQNGETTLDIACGNGTLSLLIEQKTGSRVTGIDLDAAKIKAAEKSKKRKKSQHTRFMIMDATDLSVFINGEFDTAVISMAIHQFSPEEGLKVLHEAKRVADKIILLDYSWPMKKNFFNYFTRLIERIAGGDHYRNFKLYMQNGGIDPLLKETGLVVKHRYLKGKGTLMISLCKG